MAARSSFVALAVGVAVGLTVVAIVFGIVAMPLFALAALAEPEKGLDRPVIRDNLLHLALPAGVVAGVVAGAVVGRWYRRGGRLPSDRAQGRG